MSQKELAQQDSKGVANSNDLDNNVKNMLEATAEAQEQLGETCCKRSGGRDQSN